MCFCRLLAPILRSGHFWEFFLLTPRFLVTAPWWLAGTTYLVALVAGAIPGISLLLVSELRLIFRGQSYIESLQVQEVTLLMHLRLYLVQQTVTSPESTPTRYKTLGLAC